MDLFEAIAKRHSYRGTFTNKVVDHDDLEKIVKAAISAPSGCNAQTTSFVIVEDLEIISALGNIIEKQVVSDAKAVIVCVTETKPVYHGMSFADKDCAAAVENMLLAITALGYASVWIDGALKVENRAVKVAKLLNVPDDKNVDIILPIGVPEEIKQQPTKRPFDERAWFNKYGE